MRAKHSADFPAFGRAPTASVVVSDALPRLLDDDVAIRGFGPGRALVIFRNHGAPGAANGYRAAARDDGWSF
jgi:hypothetical protein